MKTSTYSLTASIPFYYKITVSNFLIFHLLSKKIPYGTSIINILPKNKNCYNHLLHDFCLFAPNNRPSPTFLPSVKWNSINLQSIGFCTYCTNCARSGPRVILANFWSSSLPGTYNLEITRSSQLPR